MSSLPCISRFPMTEYSYSRQKQEFEEALPLALPATGGHSLTTLVPDRRIQNQLQSKLLSKLPAEIRFLIWESTIGSQKIHIIPKYRKLGHTICNAKYWAEMQSERPDLRTSSYLYTFASLPPTKQLADWSLCNLLRTCRQVYTEAVSLLYTSNTLVFWDLRAICIFKNSILPERWDIIRKVEIRAMFYRKEDIEEACEARSCLQLEAWPLACLALATIQGLRHLRILIGNPKHLDHKYLLGERSELTEATVRFLIGCTNIKMRKPLEIITLTRTKRVERNVSFWNVRDLPIDYFKKLHAGLEAGGLKSEIYTTHDII